VDEDIPAAAGKTLFVADERLEEPRAYEITKAILQHTSELTAALTAAKEITPTNAVLGSSIPFHPGALRYYMRLGRDGCVSPAERHVISAGSATLGSVFLHAWQRNRRGIPVRGAAHAALDERCRGIPASPRRA